MKKGINIKNAAGAALLLLFAGYGLLMTVKNNRLENNIRVLIVSGEKFISQKPETGAYASVLEEEGVPYQFVDSSYILSKTPQELIEICPAIIFPDSIAASLPDDLKPWVSSYLSKGGSCAFIYDAGVRTPVGYYRNDALFSEFCGVNYILYSSMRAGSYVKGNSR